MSLRIGDGGKVVPVMFSVSEWGDSLREGIELIDRRDGLLLSRLGFAKAGRGTGAIFFG